MRILLTGGCGFIGSVMTPALLDQGHEVVVADTQWFGMHLAEHPRLRVVQADVRDVDALPWDGIEVVVHLANIANDPGVELNQTLSWEVNVLGTQQLADRAVREGVGQFLFASSGSVYGVKAEERVTEDLSLVPISAYNKTKMVAERVLLSYRDDMAVHCIRPATVCGVSPRMRFDVSVNMLTLQALRDGVMTVFGGEQVRPNIHIQDIVGVFQHFVANPALPSGSYNAGFENASLLALAETVSASTGARIEITGSSDPRSYRLDSTKLLETGFAPSRSVADAISDVTEAYRSGKVVDSDECHTVRWMSRLGLGS